MPLAIEIRKYFIQIQFQEILGGQTIGENVTVLGSNSNNNNQWQFYPSQWKEDKFPTNASEWADMMETGLVIMRY